MTTPLEVLEAARSRIQAGWTQGTAWSEAPSGELSYCLAGAIAANPPVHGPAWAKLHGEVRELLYAALPCSKEGVVAWNDHPNRTKQQVIEGLDRAIRKANLTNPKDPQ